MPNEKGFEYNNLRVPDTNNTRCMKDCIDMEKMNSGKDLTTNPTERYLTPPGTFKVGYALGY